MKLLLLLVVISIVGITVYYFSSQRIGHKKKQKHGTWKPLWITSVVVVLLLVLLAWGLYMSETASDMQCGTHHSVKTSPPNQLHSAMDYFQQGNYEYDTGNCMKAISDYTISIRINSSYPQAYNNRAYTYMRMREYKDALPDLDKAIYINPRYIQALMNRGDIHNFYYAIDRQSAMVDYQKVISLGGSQGTSVCGHLMLASHNGWNIGTFIDFFRGAFRSCT